MNSGGTTSGIVNAPEPSQLLVVEPKPECDTPVEIVVDIVHPQAEPSTQQATPTAASLDGNFPTSFFVNYKSVQ